MLLDGRAQTTGIKRRGSDATLLIVFNAHHDVVKFRLPLYYEEYGWTRLIDTNAPGLPPRKFRGGAAYKAAGRSLLMFERMAVEANDKTGERVAREA
jgi:glycogen operon protein